MKNVTENGIPAEKLRIGTAYILLHIVPQAVLLALLFTVCTCYRFFPAMVFLLLPLFALSRRSARLAGTRYFLTENAVVTESGIGARTAHYFELCRLRDITVRRSLPGRIFSYMEITLTSYDGGHLVLKGIHAPGLPVRIREKTDACRKTGHMVLLNN